MLYRCAPLTVRVSGRGLAQPFALLQRAAARRENIAIGAALRNQFGMFGGRDLRPALCHGDALPRQIDGVAQQPGQTERAGIARQRLFPARHRARNCVRRQRAAPRNVLQPGIERQVGARGGGAAGGDGMDMAVGIVDQPETVAADTGHMGIAHRQRRGHRHACLDRGAAILEHAQARLTRQMMRRSGKAIIAGWCVHHVMGVPVRLMGKSVTAAADLKKNLF